MSAFNMLMIWSDVIPALHFTSILEGEFFPKWLTVLHHWLSHTADYAEVSGLCSEWLPALLRSSLDLMHGRIIPEFVGLVASG